MSVASELAAYRRRKALGPFRALVKSKRKSAGKKRWTARALAAASCMTERLTGRPAEQSAFDFAARLNLPDAERRALLRDAIRFVRVWEQTGVCPLDQ